MYLIYNLINGIVETYGDSNCVWYVFGLDYRKGDSSSMLTFVTGTSRWKRFKRLLLEKLRPPLPHPMKLDKGEVKSIYIVNIKVGSNNNRILNVMTMTMGIGLEHKSADLLSPHSKEAFLIIRRTHRIRKRVGLVILWIIVSVRRFKSPFFRTIYYWRYYEKVVLW